MPRSSFLKSLLVVGALALGMQAAQATTVEFKFTNTGSLTSFVKGGLSLSVTAKSFTTGSVKAVTTASGATVTTSTSGLGETYNNQTASDGRIDSWNATPVSASLRELLLFTFNTSVKLTKVTFTDIASGSNLIFFLDGQPNSGSAPNSNPPAIAVTSTWMPTTSVMASAIGIGARQNSAFRISSMTVETPSAVPVPAAGLMLGSLVLVPLLRRKRRAL